MIVNLGWLGAAKGLSKSKLIYYLRPQNIFLFKEKEKLRIA